MRLDFFVAHAAGLTRKQAKRAIRAGDVSVNGENRCTASRHLTPDDQVQLLGQPLSLNTEHRYLMVHKPEGVVSARTDSEHPTVLDLFLPGEAEDLHLVGRLDKDTTGLLLLTSDGQWSHRLSSPRHRTPKTYWMELAEPLTASAEAQLRAGVVLNDSPLPTRPARLEPVSDRECRLTITEGRYHQVRRMLAAVGNKVLALHRESVGELALDPALAPGEFRALSERECQWAAAESAATDC